LHPVPRRSICPGERITPPGPNGAWSSAQCWCNRKGASDEHATDTTSPALPMNSTSCGSTRRPQRRSPYVEKYRLDAKSGEERISSPGCDQDSISSELSREGVTGLGGELDLSLPVWRARFVTSDACLWNSSATLQGESYRFTVENAREPTLAQVSHQHADLRRLLWTNRCSTWASCAVKRPTVSCDK